MLFVSLLHPDILYSNNESHLISVTILEHMPSALDPDTQTSFYSCSHKIGKHKHSLLIIKIVKREGNKNEPIHKE